ncbi:DKNYY family protein [Roseimicrobium gellanilyticum]|uniref:DKNYY family protein n=1 Tax=Roseimicrobium gellanilyticum TaxID=748857 RepID=A0A366HTQ9_9BACT|nr:DKNYY domain-containing protein [Roseimicrobium gellanilyticum]RBP47673.1 DKNYY family protein [Roseimicrobium gellanilyticum]
MLKSLLPSCALVLLLSSCGDGKPGAFDKAGYHVDGKVVWYLQSWTSSPFQVAGADVATFEHPLPKGESSYAKDKNHVYLSGRALKDVDPATFEILDGRYSRDAKYVHRGEERICDDPANFEVLSGNFVKNSKAVYRLYPQVEVQTTDVANFRLLSDADYYSYFADSQYVYVNGNTVEGAMPASFKVIKGGFGKDEKQPFYFDKPMPDGTLLDSFEVLDSPYARDAKRVYFMGKIVEGADPVTFEVTDAKFQRGKDAKNRYEQEKSVPASAGNP